MNDNTDVGEEAKMQQIKLRVKFNQNEHSEQGMLLKIWSGGPSVVNKAINE